MHLRTNGRFWNIFPDWGNEVRQVVVIHCSQLKFGYSGRAICTLPTCIEAVRYSGRAFVLSQHAKRLFQRFQNCFQAVWILFLHKRRSHWISEILNKHTIPELNIKPTDGCMMGCINSIYFVKCTNINEHD